MGDRIRISVRRVKLDREQLNTPGSPVFDAAERAGKKAVELAKDEAPSRTGKLKDSIEYRVYQVPTGVAVDVGPGNEAALGYAKFVVYGTTGPIEPKNGPFLVLRDGLGPMYHRSVSGQAANPFLQRALKKLRPVDFSQ